MFSAFFLLPLEQRPAREREAGGSPAATTTEPPPACGSFRLTSGTARRRSEDGDRTEDETAAARGSTSATRLIHNIMVFSIPDYTIGNVTPQK